MLFTETIANWRDWGRVFQSIPAFTGLIREIERREGLPVSPIGSLTPGTNGVFRIGDKVVKIYAPRESGMDQSADRLTELRALRRLDELGLRAVRLWGEGVIRDKYEFAYLLMDYAEGPELGDYLDGAADDERRAYGRKLRAFTDRFNVPCEPLNDIDILRRDERWNSWSEAFRRDRAAYLADADLTERVAVHGDLCPDNVLLSAGVVMPIDFADAVMAPRAYEHSLIFFEYRRWPAFVSGYFEGMSKEDITRTVLDGILIHAYGANIASDAVGRCDSVVGLASLISQLAADSLTIER